MIKKPLLVFGMAIAMMSTTASAKPLVYVAAGSANQIIVIDAATDKVVGKYDGIDNPHSIVSTPDGEYIISGSLKEKPLAKDAKGAPHSTIYLVHPEHGHVMLTITAEGMIHHQTITPDGRYVISTHPTRGNISLADLRKNQVVKTVATGPSPNYAAVTPDGKTVYVSNSGNGTISEIDTATWTVKRALKAGPGPEHIVLSKDGTTIYVVNPAAGVVSAVDVSAGEVAKTFAIGKRLHGLDISDDGTTLFITSKTDEKFIALDPKTDTRRVLALSPSPYHLETIEGTGKVYVSSSKTGKIWVIDQKSAKLLGEIEINGEGHQMTTVR
ncbi:MAG: beta-propeller fold lactonase family protein [Proteobacteria bacterium]|nr:beta-propeller fold lactonase family protein [Pseudomonadota bacterium]